jgi:dihydroorotate dehydrogenase electron transfer subunit
LASALFLVRHWRQQQGAMPAPCLVLLEADALPFRLRPSQLLVAGMPAGVIAAVPLLEDWQIASRLATPNQALPGCFDGPVFTLAQAWLTSLTPAVRQQLRLFCFGPADWLATISEIDLSG